jgi:Ca2+-binding RTX toxin-like protein
LDDSADTALTLSAAQAAAVGSHSVALDDATVTVSDSQTAIAALSTTDIANMAASGVTNLDDSADTALTLSAAQMTAVLNGNILLDDTTVEVSGTVAADDFDFSTSINNLTIDMSSGVDVIVSGAGSDTITGGTEFDDITGNDGSDTFIFADGDTATPLYSDSNYSGTFNDGDRFTGSMDVIRDFVSGEDFLDLDDSLEFFLGDSYVSSANILAAMSDVQLGSALVFAGDYDEATTRFTLDFESGSDTLVYYDVSGANQGIVLLGMTDLVASVDVL